MNKHLRNPLMEEIRKKTDLSTRLNTHFLFEFIDSNGDEKIDYSLGQLYADTKTQDILRIIKGWEDDGSPE